MIAALVVAAFVGLEAVTRTVLFASSKDLRRFTTYEKRARALAASDHSIAFVGNSITRESTDPELIAKELRVTVDVFDADSSHLTTWIWMVRSMFWNHDASPSTIVLTFHASSLEDGTRIELGRLAQFFTTWHDWSELFESLDGLDERVEFAVSSRWATFAVRDRIKERVFDLLPGYKAWVRFEKASPKRLVAKTAHTPTYRVLSKFLKLAHEHHTRLVFVAFPTLVSDDTQAYEIDPHAADLIEKSGMTLVDLRRVPELDPAKDYADDIHLNESGRPVYSRRLVTELRRLGI